MKDFTWIRERRGELGISQQDCAERAGISRNYLSQLESGTSTNPAWHVVQRLEQVLGPRQAGETLQPQVELDSGYQIVCSVTGLKFRRLADWLAEQVGYTFENGDKITQLESFQVIREGPYNDCIAVCRVCKQD